MCQSPQFSEQASPTVSPSLAGSISAFAPPTPGPEQLCAAALVQASVELAALADSARCAASACPESIPLVETLCAAVTKELVALNAEQASAAHGKNVDSAAGAALSRRVCDLRAATAEGLQVLRQALELGSTGAGQPPTVGPCQSPVFVRTVSAPALQQLPARHAQHKEFASIFGAVALNMKQAVSEIRQTKARQALNRSDTLMGAVL